jgi:hypothetical protein
MLAHHGLLLASGSNPLPPDTFGNLTMWLDATSTTYLLDASGGSSVTADGQAVGLWKSRSPTGVCVEQSTSGKRGLYKTNIVNGKSVLRFDGVNDDYLCRALSGNTAGAGLNLASFFSGTAKTIVCVLSISGAPSGFSTVSAGIMGDDPGGQAFGLHVANVDASNVKIIGANNDGGTDVAEQTIPKNAWRVVSLRHTGGNIQVRINRGSWATTATGATYSLIGAARVGIGSDATKWWSGDLLHLATYSTGLSDANLASLEDWGAAEAGITL